MDEPGHDRLDLENTRIAFEQKSNKELRWMKLLFNLMNNSFFVNISTNLALVAIKLRIPFAKELIKKTIFKQFVGGESLLDCQATIDDLYKFKALTILDYGAESKSEEEDLENVKNETLKAIDLAAANYNIPVVSTKITGLVDNEILYKLNDRKALNEGEQYEYDQLKLRLLAIGKRAEELGVGVFIDAEESWMQDAIDQLVEEMMVIFNTKKAIIYNTYQMYRWDRLQYLKDSHQRSVEGGYFLGAKLVRGAYMEKERERAIEMNYKSPIQTTKEDTDRDFDLAIKYVMEHYKTIASCCASHNMKSNLLQAQIIEEKSIPKDHRHVNFCQLYGMSDYITFNIASEGYNVAKYVPYGPVEDVIPYLIRRARENTAVSGEMSRELNYISKELKRRGL